MGMGAIAIAEGEGMQGKVIYLIFATHRSDARQERDGMDAFFFLGTEVGPALFRCLQFLWEPHHLKPLYPHNEKPSFSKASLHQRLSRMPSIDKESPELAACPTYLAGVC
ncbi:hypothetical protein FNV43_RR08268 [Rhamnella rubrinervis]|uniref:Uncharacterized protein n=1 Tax=Rhamnella rubrinervis TaxID=2594499 RepID=A0A8K0HGW0_9ROSA|nr:hypothetical protein FNV43_RR08268 [Rhamnella rubrinervis]